MGGRRAWPRLGYDVGRQRVDVPAGESWGVAVEAGRSVNVVATPPGLRPGRAAPRRRRPPRHGAAGAGRGGQRVGCGGAARRRGGGRDRRTRLPVVFVAFGAEEPRGPGDADHHYGSRRYVDRAAARRASRAVREHGVAGPGGRGRGVPVGSASDRPTRSSAASWPRPGGPGCRRWRRRSSAAATTGRSCGPASRARGWARRRTPATTRPADVPGVVSRDAARPASAGWCWRGWRRAEAGQPRSPAHARREARSRAKAVAPGAR